MKNVRAFAPATIANVSVFDVIGLALNEPGDEVEAELTSEFSGVKLVEIVNNPDLPLGPENVVQAVGQKLYDSIRPNGGEGIKLTLYKNMKIGTGMGSSASSEAAAALAILELLGYPIERNSKPVLEALVYGEQVAAGFQHPDNVLPSYLGGALVIHDAKNLNYVRFYGNDSIYFAVVAPDRRLDTRDMRKLIPPSMSKLVDLCRLILRLRVGIQEPSYDLSCLVHTDNLVDGVSEETADRYLQGALEVMYGLRDNNAELLGRGTLKDGIVTATRGRYMENHIGGFYAVKDAALQEGAYGFLICGSGPALGAVASTYDGARAIGESMLKAWEKHGVKAALYVSPINNQGARLV